MIRDAIGVSTALAGRMYIVKDIPGRMFATISMGVQIASERFSYVHGGVVGVWQVSLRKAIRYYRQMTACPPLLGSYPGTQVNLADWEPTHSHLLAGAIQV